MMLFHRNCSRLKRWWRGVRGFSRLILQKQTDVDLMISTRTYICEGCGVHIHIDTDWSEGASVGVWERLD